MATGAGRASVRFEMIDAERADTVNLNRVLAPFLGLVLLAGCENGGGGGTTNASIGGSAAIGVSSGNLDTDIARGGSGPPLGRTAAERQARRDYYSGPRGFEF